MPDPQQRWPDDMPLEAQLGNALGLALAFLKSGDWNNQDMARIEAPFKAWCDQVVDGPAVPEGREPASVVTQPSDEEIMELMPPQMHEDFAFAARAMANEAGTDSQKAKGFMRIALNLHAVDLALAVLARFGNHFPDAKKMVRPAPVPPGERQSAPVPVPVSERLPGPGDCDAEGRCWWLAPETAQKCAVWCFGPKYPPSTFGATHWLPAHALPLPAGEGWNDR